jgi:predicted nucleotidyltransferase
MPREETHNFGWAYSAALRVACYRRARAYHWFMAEMQSSGVALAARESREEIARIAAAHGARNVRVFGSAGRGEADEASDLDLLVDMAEGRSLFDLVALSDALEDSLGIEVDVVTEGGLSPYMRDRVLDEAVAL